jgi:hypothetical protein
MKGNVLTCQDLPCITEMQIVSVSPLHSLSEFVSLLYMRCLFTFFQTVCGSQE